MKSASSTPNLHPPPSLSQTPPPQALASPIDSISSSASSSSSSKLIMYSCAALATVGVLTLGYSYLQRRADQRKARKLKNLSKKKNNATSSNVSGAGFATD